MEPDALTNVLAQQKMQPDDDPMAELLRLYQQQPAAAPLTPEQQERKRLSLAMMLTGQGPRNRQVGRVGEMMYGDINQQQERERREAAARLEDQRRLAGQRVGWQREDTRRGEDVARQQAAEAEARRRWDIEQAQRAADQSSADWMMIADPVTGGFMQYNRRTGESRPIAPSGQTGEMNTSVPGFAIPQGVSPRATEAEQKSFNFAVRLARAVPQAQEIINSGYAPSIMDLMIAQQAQTNPAFAPLIEQAVSQEARTYLDAVAPIVNAILRKESGAAITTDEWTRAFREWLPRPGEPEEVTRNKLAKMQNEMNALAATSGGYARYWVGPQGSTVQPGATAQPGEDPAVQQRREAARAEAQQFLNTGGPQ
jgi:hypothetical protein